MREIGDEVVAGEDLRADRHAHLDRLAVGTVPPRAAAAAALRRLDPAPPLQRRQVSQRGVGHEHDLAALAAVTAVGPALGDELLAAERQPAVAAAAGLDVDLRAVRERS
jgi:hypothetical protein